MNACTDGLPGAGAPVLTSDLLTRVYELNLDYVELLVLEHSNGARGLQYLPDKVVALLVAMSRESRQVVATTPFALYSLGFEDHEFWRTALRTLEDQPVDARYGVLSSAVTQSSFCEVALLFAWHVAVIEPIAARVLFGMPAQLIDSMSRIQLWQLRRISVDYPGLLMPRWPSNPCFWPDILKFAAARDLRRLETVQQLGHQLIAVELQASCARRSAIRERQRNLMAQRLRKAKPPSR